mmetsp:Transcript_89547/g.148343  ORF Transcript_89547/g.148343 Transcript_89547/m.148343 type:complete len:189 (-) Transcript_89547:50-616(-)
MKSSWRWRSCLVTLAAVAAATSVEPPAQFHTRCVTFLNGVLEQADGKLEKVGNILQAHCGEVRSGLATEPLPEATRARCKALGAHLMAELRRARDGAEDNLDSQRLVSSSFDVTRHHRYYAPMAAWCSDVYFLTHQRRSGRNSAAARPKWLRSAATLRPSLARSAAGPRRGWISALGVAAGAVVLSHI